VYKPSPDVVKKNRLKSIGITPKNNVSGRYQLCYYTNWVSPYMAFDAAKIKGNKIVVKTLPKGTESTNLGRGFSRILNEEDLMIC